MKDWLLKKVVATFDPKTPKECILIGFIEEELSREVGPVLLIEQEQGYCMKSLLDKVWALPRRIEPLGGQNFSYVQLGELITIIDFHELEQNAKIAELRSVLREIIAISDRKHDAWDKAKQLISYGIGGVE